MTPAAVVGFDVTTNRDVYAFITRLALKGMQSNIMAGLYVGSANLLPGKPSEPNTHEEIRLLSIEDSRCSVGLRTRGLCTLRLFFRAVFLSCLVICRGWQNLQDEKKLHMYILSRVWVDVWASADRGASASTSFAHQSIQGQEYSTLRKLPLHATRRDAEQRELQTKPEKQTLWAQRIFHECATFTLKSKKCLKPELTCA